MAGIYIHIPFCRQACYYCNFHFSTTLHLQASMVDALLREIALQQHYLSTPVETIYFGGGTPSLLSAHDLKRLLEKLYTTFAVTDDAEITFEANPDDITSERLQAWKQCGVNRLSIGIQSFAEADLQWMNRAHNATQARDCIVLAQQEGFDNLTIDLIYGTPVLSDEQWAANVQTVIALKVQHLSCYALTVEPRTALEKLIEQHKRAPVDADKQARHFEQLMQWMHDAGYEHYEISNFAKPGHRSRHNSSYWQGKHYLGIGPSAHSFNGESRQWNVANNALYIQSLEQDRVPFEIETLTPEQQINEYIMTALRTMEGLSLQHLSDSFGEAVTKQILQQADNYIHRRHLEQTGTHLRTTNAGKLLADGIAADLFVG